MKIKPTSEKAKSASKVSSRSHLGDTSCVPKLRFPHLTTPWKTTPLSRLLRFQNGVNAPAEKYGRGVKFVSVSDIIQNDYVTYDNIVGSVDIDDATLERYSVENGDMGELLHILAFLVGGDDLVDVLVTQDVLVLAGLELL